MKNGLRKNGWGYFSRRRWSAWERHDLETFQKSLKALKKTEEEKQAAGEIVSEHPGCLIAHDSFYVDNRKEVDRIYQQTVIASYSKVRLPSCL